MIGKWHEKHLMYHDCEGLLIKMRQYSIIKALIFHSLQWRNDPVTGNQILVDQLQTYDMLYPVAVLTPLIDREFDGRKNLLDFLRERKFRAIRLFPLEHHYTLSLFNIEGLMDVAAEFNKPVMLDAGQVMDDLETFYQLLKAYPEVKFIFMNPPHTHPRVLYSIMEKCENLFIEISGMNGFRALEETVSLIGPKRLLCGTKMPIIPPGPSLGRLIYASISEKDKEDIAYNNAVSLFQ